jgi:hypothetical protein
VAAGVLVIGLVIVFSLKGGNRTAVKPTNTNRDKDDPWQKALAAIRRESEVESCRRLLNDLNSDLSKVSTAPQPEETKPEELAAITASLGLNEAESKEIKPSAYTALDAAYLAETIYLRDVALGLEVSTLPPAKKAVAAFNWVTRQVVLTPQDPKVLVLPPLSLSYILRRGSGTGLERAYAFLELCRQLNLDAYLIGPPEAKTKPSTATPRSPFWAVGVRADKQILLFDPWEGERLPFNLEQLRSQPAEFAAKFEELAKANNTTVQEFRKAEVFIAVPLSAFAARLKLLEEKLEAERGVKLKANRETLLKNASNVTKDAPVSFWNPPKDLFSLTRTLANILSESEGGFAENQPNGASKLGNQFRASLIPANNLFAIPREVAFTELSKTIALTLIDKYQRSFLAPPSPRERFQRGQFAEATKLLVKEWDDYTKMTERSRNEPNRQQTINDWIKRANHLFSQLNGAMDPAERNLAQQEVNRFWKSDIRGLDLLVEQSLGPAGTAEAIFLLALCKHELAERLSGPDATGPEKLSEEAREAWLVAYDWWKRYGEFAADKDAKYPGRDAHAKKLTERAGRMAKILP